MERVQQLISQQNIWMRALLLTLAISLALFIVGLLMGKLRHLVIEGALRRLLGAKAAIIVGYYLTFIGTLHHELAHALGYLITGGRVHRISIIPRAQPDGTIRLGYVIGSTRGPWLMRAVQDTASATAPLWMGFLSVYLLWRFALPGTAGIGMTIFFYYVIISIILHMELSKEDLKILLHGLLPTLLLLYLVIVAVLLIRK